MNEAFAGHKIDWAIVIAYLGLTLFVGLYKASFNIYKFKDYVLDHSNFSYWTLVGTLIATFIGGTSTMGLSAKVYQYGISFFFIQSSFILQQAFVTFLMAPRIRKFVNAISIGDIMEEIYGKNMKIITGFASLLLSAGIVGSQVSATGYIFHYFLGIPHTMGSLIGCGIVIIYSMIGGIRSVIRTDILQCIMLGVTIPMLAIIAYMNIGDPDSFTKILASGHLDIPNKLSWVEFISLCLLFMWGNMLFPPHVQRILLARNLKHLYKAGILTMLLSVPAYMLITFIGLAAYIVWPNIDPTLAMPHLIQISLPVGLYGIVISGLLAIIMSSADSSLNTATIALVHDIIKPLKPSWFEKYNELTMAKISTAVIGCGTLFFALYIKEIISILTFSFQFWAPVVVIPFISGILGWAIRGKLFYITLAVSSIITVLWNSFCAETQIAGALIGMSFNCVMVILYNIFSPNSSKGELIQQ